MYCSSAASRFALPEKLSTVFERSDQSVLELLEHDALRCFASESDRVSACRTSAEQSSCETLRNVQHIKGPPAPVKGMPRRRHGRQLATMAARKSAPACGGRPTLDHDHVFLRWSCWQVAPMDHRAGMLSALVCAASTDGAPCLSTDDEQPTWEQAISAAGSCHTAATVLLAALENVPLAPPRSAPLDRLLQAALSKLLTRRRPTWAIEPYEQTPVQIAEFLRHATDTQLSVRYASVEAARLDARIITDTPEPRVQYAGKRARSRVDPPDTATQYDCPEDKIRVTLQPSQGGQGCTLSVRKRCEPYKVAVQRYEKALAAARDLRDRAQLPVMAALS